MSVLTKKNKQVNCHVAVEWYDHGLLGRDEPSAVSSFLNELSLLIGRHSTVETKGTSIPSCL